MTSTPFDAIMDTTPYWSDRSPFPRFPKLDSDLTADVVVVGAGMTGLTTAYLLAEAGKAVIVLERGRCAFGDTGYTSAHLTMVTDTGLSELVNRFGRDHAQAVWDAGLAGIAQIHQIVRDHTLDADFTWLDGYLHAPAPKPSAGTTASTEFLNNEAALATELGFDAEFIEAVPFLNLPGIRFANQARLHPRRYLAGMARVLTSKGIRIFEESAASEFHSDPLSVSANGFTVGCKDIVIATNNPLVGVSGLLGATLLQTKLSLYNSYVVAGRAPKHTVPDALWWDTEDPYGYLRVEPHRDHDVVVYGGADHKTGQAADTVACYRTVETRLTAMVPGIDITHHWSGQIIETPDGLPYIGQTTDHQYVATGYCGNGLTFGTVAAMIITDQILGRINPWTDLFDPSRKALGRGLWHYIKENADYPYYMIRDRFAGAEGKSLRAVRRGHGKIVERNGAKCAAYRDDDGVVTLRSAICPHMGCIVGWNAAERTWDCPCHGSRFKTTGEVISGPAESPLAPIETDRAQTSTQP